MGIVTASPRLPSTEPRIPVFPNGRRPTWLVAVVVLFAVLPVLMAVADDRVGLRLVMGALALTILGAAACLHVLFGTIQERLVRVDPSASGIWFRPAPAATAVPFVFGGLLLLPAVAQIVVDLGDLATMPSFLLTRAPYALALLGVGVIVMNAVRLREPAGLHVTAEGLEGIRGRGRVDWTWDELAEVGVGIGPVAKLNLVVDGAGPRVEAPMLALGSDPNQVATVVRYFLDVPSARAELNGPGPVALRSVDEALRAREG
ncbi:hypothetical protein RWH43_16590 [Microbacterium sp. KSW2-21]|uniref:PH domain-containing protein n=1 Tax=Microbacterium algihabitans TaxID=3075992 RepID=A0ABU3RZX1_9MICO|nr:hypothetical protein [Microbacterium sp. KSW2-21]MDU0328379.1 hypothetical protein [Microbacterium sp. KSW2-21]